MLKIYSKQFSLLAKLFDGLLAFGIWLTLYYFRFYYWEPGNTSLDLVFYKAGFLVSLLTVYFFHSKGLYESHRLASRQKEIWSVFRANSLAVVSFVVVLYFLADARLSRFVILSYYAASTVGFIFYRSLIRQFLRMLRRRGHNLRYAVLVGHNKTVEEYVQVIQSFKDSGIEFLGWADSAGLADKYDIKDLGEELCPSQFESRPDSIVVGYDWAGARKVEDFLRTHYNGLVPIVILPDTSYSYLGFKMQPLAGVPAIMVNQPSFSTVDIILKRVFDVCLSGIALLILSPFLGLMALLVRLSSRGPIFYVQDRIGLDGHEFKMIKFRTMKVDPDDPGYGWTVSGDPRRTKIGEFLRSTSMDELPQLWNVLVGDMSLVGPRPEMVYYVQKHKEEIPAYMLRHKVKVGITGWAQVNGWRGDTSIKSRVEFDLYYIRNWSLWLDIRIMFMTVFKGLVNKNAY